MKTHRLVVWTALATLAGLLPLAHAQNAQTITIRAARVFDGEKVLSNAVVEVEGSKIVAIDQRRGLVTHDLGDVTLMPGMIDVHTHITDHFGPDGKYPPSNETPEERDCSIQANLKATLVAGFTTVQSVGSRGDKLLGDAVLAGTLVGPRILTSLAAIFGGPPEAPRSADELRAIVRQFKADRADVIKIVASGSFGSAGAPTMTQEQLDAICDEARKLGLRTLVHAHGAEAIIRVARAGCTQVEHGVYASDEALRLMKDRGVYFDPNVGLVLQTQLENKARFLGQGNYDDERFVVIEKALGISAEMFERALESGVTMPLGTDAGAGGHGQNAREIITRVEHGQSPIDGIISATSLAAKSLGLEKTIGTLAPGYEADIVAVGGDPTKEIKKLRDARLVMKGGRVVKEAAQ